METNLRIASPSASANPTSPTNPKEEVMSSTSNTSDVSAVAGSSVSILNPTPAGKEESKKRPAIPQFHPERDSEDAKKAITKAADFITVAAIHTASREIESGISKLHEASKSIVSGTARVGEAQASLELNRPAIVKAWKPARLLLRHMVKGGRDFCDMWAVTDVIHTAQNIVAHRGEDDAGLDAPIAKRLRDAVDAAEPASVELTAAKETLDKAKTAYLNLRSALKVDIEVLNSLVKLERAEAKRKQLEAVSGAVQRKGRRGKAH
jgi:flagellar hook-basal body complex protein FliE